MIKKYKIKCNLFWNFTNYYENDEIEIEDTVAKKYPYFFEEIKQNEIGERKNINSEVKKIPNKNKQKIYKPNKRKYD